MTPTNYNNHTTSLNIATNKVNNTKHVIHDTRRKRVRSTSSSSNSASMEKNSKSQKESLELSTSSSSEEIDTKKRSYTTPGHSIERKGW